MNVSRKRFYVPKPSYQVSKRSKANRKTRFTNRFPVAKMWRPVSGKAGQGNNITVTFIYATHFTLNGSVTAGAATQQFALSSLFDPDVTGAGGQPIPLDQYAAIYEFYRVTECSYKISYFSGDSSIPQIAGYIVSDSSATTTDMDRYIQNGQCEWSPLGPRGSSTDCVTLMGTCDIAKAHGISKQKLMTDDLYAAEFSTNPAERIFMNVFIAAPGGSDPAAGDCYIELRFTASLEGNQLIVDS